MKSLVTAALKIAPLIALLLVSACDPTPGAQSDEEKEPHFMAGKSRVTALDFAGAIESFQQALASNPNSAAAHFELGWLYERKQGDPPAAIYHYERYLKLRPKAENAEIVRQHVLACKQELARTVSLGPVTERQQRDLEKLAEEKERLTQEVNALKEENLQLRIALAAQPAKSQSESGGTSSNRSASSAPGQASRTGTTTQPGTFNRSSQPSSIANRYRRFHRVKQGETLTAISRQYGVRVESIIAANPGLDPRRLRPGRELSIP